MTSKPRSPRTSRTSSPRGRRRHRGRPRLRTLLRPGRPAEPHRPAHRSGLISAARVLQLGPERYGGVVRVVQPALRQHDATGRALPSPRALGVGRERASGSSTASSSSSSSRLSTIPSRRRGSGADREALEVPGDVLAHVAHALVRAHVDAEQLGVAPHGRRRPGRGSGAVGIGRPANAASRSPKSHGRPRQPRPTTTPSQPVVATIAQRIVGAEDVAVAEDRELGGHGFAEPGDGRPVGRAGVALRRRARVQGHGGDPRVGGDRPGVEVGVPARRRCRCAS